MWCISSSASKFEFSGDNAIRKQHKLVANVYGWIYAILLHDSWRVNLNNIIYRYYTNLLYLPLINGAAEGCFSLSIFFFMTAIGGIHLYLLIILGKEVWTYILFGNFSVNYIFVLSCFTGSICTTFIK